MPINCPACDQHNYADTDAKGRAVRGMRTCPQCLTQIKITKSGIVVVGKVQARTSRNVKRAGWADRLYKVIQPDGSVLCACCGQTINTLDDWGSVPAGWDSDPRMFARFTDGRVIAFGQTIRGFICRDCSVKHGAIPKVMTRDKARNDRGYIVRPQTFNNPAQREAAEYGMALIDRAIRLRNPINWGLVLAGAHNGHDTALWAHTGDPRWLIGQLMISVTSDESGKLRLVRARTSHPKLCACPMCVSRKHPLTPSQIVAMADQYTFSGKLPRRVIVSSRIGGGWQRLQAAPAQPHGIGRQSLSTVSAMLYRPSNRVPHGIDASDTRIGWDHRRRRTVIATMPTAQRSHVDPPMPALDVMAGQFMLRRGLAIALRSCKLP